jgi:hypothetical protein
MAPPRGVADQIDFPQVEHQQKIIEPYGLCIDVITLACQARRLAPAGKVGNDHVQQISYTSMKRFARATFESSGCGWPE